MIGNNAFKGNDLTSVTLPNGVERIGESAFNGNDFAFTQVSLPNSVTFIGKYAFSMNGIDSIILPSVAVTGFLGWIDNDGTEFAGGTKIKYTGNEYRAKIVYTLKDEDVEVNANGIITSCNYDFSSTDIIIPEILDGITIKGIEDKSSTGVFEDKGITSMQLPNTMQHVGNYAFSGNELTELIMPSNLKYIGTQAFSNNNLDEVNIPNSIIFIGQQAFWGIDSIVLPTPTEPGFAYWVSSSGSHYPGGSKVKPLYDWFEAKIVYTLTDADVRIIDGVIDSCLYDFSSKYIKIPDSLNNQPVIGIANGKELTFSNYYGVFSNKDLKEIQLPVYLSQIGNYAFYENNLVDVIILPENVKYIGKDAFSLNSSFKGVQLPSPTDGILICKNWTDNYNTVYEIGDTVKNFYGRTYTAQFTYAPGTSVIALTGSLNFEDIEVNSQESSELTISNSGNAPFTVTNIILPEGFVADWTSGEVTTNNNQIVNITFSPTEEKTYSGMIKVITNATMGVDSIAINGTTVPEKISHITLTGTLNFGEVEIATQKVIELTISNNGNMAFTVNDITLPEGYFADWTYGEITPDADQSVNITFIPSEVKTYSGMIKIISDATEGVDSIAVSGAGINTISAPDVSISKNVCIYPNPASSFIEIPSGFENADIELLTIGGKLIFKLPTNSHRVDISELDNGMYLLKIVNNQITLQSKFIKQ